MPDDFTPPFEELQRVSNEISLLRRDLQTGLSALTRIEKRLRAAFPNYPSKKEERRDRPRENQAASQKSPDQLNADFDVLISATKERGDEGFEAAVSALSEPDVIALAHELGIGSLKTTSIRKAREGVRKRVQESLLLSFIPRTPRVGESSTPKEAENN